jgi:prepilin-type N-terminal cleavage/methylation domain-containing protein
MRSGEISIKRNGENMLVKNLKKTKTSNNHGFTLVELMVVLVIVGLLASFAIPRFSKAVYKTKASEFPTILTAIYNAELSIRDETGQFAPVDELDIDERSISESNLFEYTVSSSDWTNEFVAQAVVKEPGFGKAKAGMKATINQDGEKGGDEELVKYVRTWK